MAAAACALHKPHAPPARLFQASWHCTIDAVNAKTGKPVALHCLDADGVRYEVRAE